MAKKAKAVEDIPGIYENRNPIPLKIGSSEAKATLDKLPPWSDWFASVGPRLEEPSGGDDEAVARSSFLALHLWKWCSEKIDSDPAAAKIIRNAVELGQLIERIQILRSGADKAVRGRRLQRRELDARNDAAKLRTASGRLKAEAVEAIEGVRREYPDRVGDVDFIKSKAAMSLSISKRALNKRLEKVQEN